MFRVTVEFLPFGDEARSSVVAQGEITPYGEADYFVSPRNYRYSLGEHRGTLIQVPKSHSVWELLAEAIVRSINNPPEGLAFCGHSEVFHGETEDWCKRCGETVGFKEYPYCT